MTEGNGDSILRIREALHRAAERAAPRVAKQSDPIECAKILGAELGQAFWEMEHGPVDGCGE